ncbi:hypothetical protein D3C86_1182780 [compost metagenome]
MYAFIQKNGILIKCYDMGDDWMTMDSLGNERWRSQWQADKQASAFAAIQQHAYDCLGVYVKADEITLCKGFPTESNS